MGIWNGRVHMRARVRSSTCCMPRVLFAECAEWVSGTICLCWPARDTAQVRCASEVIAMDLAARMPGKQRTLSYVGNSPRASTCCHAQGDDKPQVSSDGRDERACHKPPPWQCKKCFFLSLAPSTRPSQDVADILFGQRKHSLAEWV